MVAARMRRTEVRPMASRRAISALLMPARWSLRISADLAAAVAGRPSRFPFSRAWARPARTRSRRISCSNAANTRQQSSHGAARRRGQIQSFGQRHEPDAEVIQFLQCGHQIRQRASPPVQTPDQHDVDLAASGCLHQLLAAVRVRMRRSRPPSPADDRPAARDRVLAHRAHLQRNLSAGPAWRRGHTGRPATFLTAFVAWPKTSPDFAFAEARFTAISACPIRVAEHYGFRPRS